MGELIVEIVRSGGTLMPSAAADAAAIVGAMNLPELFLIDAYVKPFCSA